MKYYFWQWGDDPVKDVIKKNNEPERLVDLTVDSKKGKHASLTYFLFTILYFNISFFPMLLLPSSCFLL